MNFFEYTDFDDFCKKNHCTPQRGIEIIDAELKELKKR